ncbi:DUF5683 domain-containing protein [Parafilimonas sp.]|uniref:DUF5683 domain-containing protein n=1 Tax=Parafilimonas sp. TaxID=1969739 RepID=UPI0039E340C2
MRRQTNMHLLYCFISIFIASAVSLTAIAQKPDTAINVNNGKKILPDTLKPEKKDSLAAALKKDSVPVKKKHDPHIATLRSALIPGWGQAYNREYWKIPIVYGALAVPACLFVYNNTWYQRTKQAYDILVNGGDTNKVYPVLRDIDPSYIQSFRNEFRKDRDYSALFFLLAWGLNVVDATVFGHLKDFDVSDDLSMRVQPDFNIVTKTPALSVALNFKPKRQPKMLPASF